jgi:two-component system, NtrC family, nitrogen regulation sensor histidine kinase GlnL
MDLWREIVDSLGDAVIVISSAFEPLVVNPAAETLLDASQISRSLIGRMAQRNKWLGRMIRSCLETAQSLDTPESVLVLDRREAIVRAEVSPLLSSQGRPEGAIVLLHDLSHQKGAEQAFQPDQNAVRLSPAGLAHEVKNPLTGIKGAAELLASMFPSDARAQQYCGLILDGVNRIASLVEQVLAVSGPHRLKREPVNIHQILHQALRMAGVYPESPPGLAVEQHFDPSLPEVTGDAAALERVFLNLIRNALDAIDACRPPAIVKAELLAKASHGPRQTDTSTSTTAMPTHTIRLRTAMETQFRLSTHGRRRQFLRVAVSDSGKGMTPEEIKQLFTPFFTTKPSGTGLGLVLSQKVIALHGGKLWAECGGVGAESGNALVAHNPSLPPDSTMQATSDDVASSTRGRRTARGMTFYVMLPVGPD